MLKTTPDHPADPTSNVQLWPSRSVGIDAALKRGCFAKVPPGLALLTRSFPFQARQLVF